MYYGKAPENNITIIKQIIKDEIKDEIVSELYARQRYNQALDAYHREVEIIPAQGEGQQPDKTYFKDATNTLLDDRYTVHHPNQTRENSNENILEDWTHLPRGNQNNGILYGIGTVALLGILLPQFRQRIMTLVGNTASEGVELIEKARFLVAKAKEDMEDLIAEANFNNAIRKSRQR